MASKGEGVMASGIAGLDSVCGGGLPRGGMVLLTGEAGTGKTTLAYEFLLRGAVGGEKGLLVTSNAPVEKYVSQLMPLRIREGKAPGKGVTLMPMDCSSLDAEGYLAMMSRLGEEASKLGVKRLMVDPLPRSLLELGESELVTVLNGLSSMLHERGLTAVLVTDGAGRAPLSLADGVLHLGLEEREGDMLRTIQVLKMRGARHSLSRHAMMLSPEGMLFSRLIRGVRQ